MKSPAIHLVAGVLAILLISGSKDAMAIEEHVYEVKQRWNDEIELRNYGSVIVAETEVAAPFSDAGSQGFRPLAGFIFGNNRSKSKVAMTAPVTQESSDASRQSIAMTAPVSQQTTEGGKYLIRFTMPSSFTRESLPAPVDPKVRILEIPPRQMAAIRYSGSWSEDHYEEHRQKLDGEITSRGYEKVGPWVFARYNSPWTLWFLRRNEVLVEVRRL